MWTILSKGRKPKKQALLEALAEEDEQILALAYAHATYLKKFGVDIEQALDTAIQNAEALSKAYQEGYYDAIQRSSRMEEFEINHQLFEINHQLWLENECTNPND